MKLKNTLYICSTYHHAIVTVAKCLSIKQNADVILCDDIPKYEELQYRLLKSNVINHVYLFRRSKCPGYNPKEIMKRLFGRHSKHKKIIQNELKVDFGRFDDIYIFHDGTKLGRYLMDIKCKYHLIEDGLDFFKVIKETPSYYMLEKYSGLSFIIRRLFNIGYIFCGQNKYCIDIEVNDLNGVVIPPKKVFEKSKKDLYSNLTISDKKILLQIFNTDSIQMTLYKKTALLLTIPLFEDKYVKTVDNQIKIYSDLINELKQDGYTVFIKAHPRDAIDYQSNFNDVIVLDRTVPTEIYNFDNSFRFDKAVSINSSSIRTIANIGIKEPYGIDYLLKYPTFINSWVLDKIDGL